MMFSMRIAKSMKVALTIFINTERSPDYGRNLGLLNCINLPNKGKMLLGSLIQSPEGNLHKKAVDKFL